MRLRSLRGAELAFCRLRRPVKEGQLRFCCRNMSSGRQTHPSYTPLLLYVDRRARRSIGQQGRGCVRD